VENSGNHFEHQVRVLNRATGSNRKPAGAYGAVLPWQVGGEKPATRADLSKIQFNRKMTLIVTHTEADKAKTIYSIMPVTKSKGDMRP
jgi:hypothetical protein